MNEAERLRGGSRTAATSKMERFVIIVNGWKLLTIITKCSILDVAAALDPPLHLSLSVPPDNIPEIRGRKPEVFEVFRGYTT